MKKVFLYALGIFVVLAFIGQFVSQPTPKPASSDLPKRADDQPLDCSGAGYTAVFKPQTQYAPVMVDVTFRGKQPRPVVAENALRSCMKHAHQVKSFQSDVLGTAWWSKSGTTEDDDIQTLTDGEGHLASIAGSTDILSWTEYLKRKPSTKTQ